MVSTVDLKGSYTLIMLQLYLRIPESSVGDYLGPPILTLLNPKP